MKANAGLASDLWSVALSLKKGSNDFLIDSLRSKCVERSCIRLPVAVAVRILKAFVLRALFTWRQGAPANRATRLGGLKHRPPLNATHLSGIVSGLSFERPLSTTNKMADKRNVLANKLACPLPVTHLLH